MWRSIMKRVVRGIVGIMGVFLLASQTEADITTAYSDDFSGYSNGYSLGDSDHWTIVRGFYTGAVTANTFAKYVTSFPGQLATRAATEGQLALIYDDQNVGAGSFKISLDVTGVSNSNPGYKGGLVFNWSTLTDSNTLSGYVFQVYYGSPNGTSDINAAVRLIKYSNASSENASKVDEAPTPTEILLDWTDLTGFSALSSSSAITLSVTSNGNGTFALSATQGTLSWTTTITDANALSGGYAGIATQRGAGASEATDDRGWANIQYDNFSVSPVPEPAALGLLSVGGLMLIGLRHRN